MCKAQLSKNLIMRTCLSSFLNLRRLQNTHTQTQVKHTGEYFQKFWTRDWSPWYLPLTTDVPGMDFSLPLCRNKIISATCLGHLLDCLCDSAVGFKYVKKIFTCLSMSAVRIGARSVHCGMSCVFGPHEELIEVVFGQELVDILHWKVLSSLSKKR